MLRAWLIAHAARSAMREFQSKVKEELIRGGRRLHGSVKLIDDRSVPDIGTVYQYSYDHKNGGAATENLGWHSAQTQQHSTWESGCCPNSIAWPPE